MSHDPPAYGSKGPTMSQPGYAAPPPVVGEVPVQCTCPQCRATIVSRTVKKNGMVTWLVCLGLCFFGFWCCCCIPFCVDAVKDTEHYCPQCNAMLGVKKIL